MISVVVSGSFKQMESTLKNLLKIDIPAILESHGAEGVRALRSATPIESGLAAQSWDYKVSKERLGYSLTFTNSDVENGFPVVIMYQYGHGTGTGGYVEGVDFINPAIRPIFDKIINKVWKAVTSA
jgi:hypothetical protein